MSFNTFAEWDSHTQNLLGEEGKRKEDQILHIIQINVRSLKKHHDELNVYIGQSLVDIDVIILTEINIEANEPLSFAISGFHEASVRREGKKGGGILVYIKNCWLSDRTELCVKHAEVIVMNIQKAEVSFTVCAVYRPPSGSLSLFYEEFDKLINSFNNNDYIVIAGDFNIDVMSKTKYGVQEYLDILSNYGLRNMIVGYTREESLADKITKTGIDHIIVRTGNFMFIGGIIQQKVADHYFVALRIIDKSTTRKAEEQEYKQILDNNKVDRSIKRFNWNSLLKLDHISLYETVVETLGSIYERSIKPIKLKPRNASNKWIDKDINELSSEKNKLWNRCKKYPDDTLLKEEYRQLRNRVTAKIRLSKKKFHMTQLRQSGKNIKETWNVVNQIIAKPPRISVDECIKKNFGVTDLESLSNDFNNAFVNQVENLRSQVSSTAVKASFLGYSQNSAYMPRITELDLQDIICTMSMTKPAGYDKIRLRDLRVNLDSLKHIILEIGRAHV